MFYFGLHWSEQVRVAPAIVLTDEQERELSRLARSKRTSVRLAQRARIVLLAAQGLQNKDIAEQLAIGRVQVARWRERYLEGGLQGIERDLPRGAPPVKVDVAKLVELTTQTTPEAATHWSTRKMGAALGVSASTVMRHWQAHGLKPHLVRGFKVSRDPQFVDKLEDIVGLYLSPPEHALVLCCDEKSQVQALDRTQPGLPLKKGRAQTMTHDYKRHGTTTLFAALNVLDGQVIGQCQQRHTHAEWLKFLRTIDRETSKDKTLHLIFRPTHRPLRLGDGRARRCMEPGAQCKPAGDPGRGRHRLPGWIFCFGRWDGQGWHREGLGLDRCTGPGVGRCRRGS
jgi:transposase